MKKDIFKGLIVDFQERDLSHVVDREIEIPLDTGKIITIMGVRRCGKTHLLFSLINKPGKKIDRRNIVYINFEDDRLFPLQSEDLATLIDAYYELYPDKKNEKVFLFFDEIQDVKGWEKFVRRIYDTENCAIFITGSSSKFLSKEIASSLRGRTLSYEVFPLSFKEFLRFKNIEIDMYSSRSAARIKNALNEYLIKGGFPEVVNYDQELFTRTLQEYIDLIMYRDILERFNITNTFLFKYLIKFCFTNVSTLISFNKLYNDFRSQGLHLSRNTIYEYVSYLEDAYALFTVPVYSTSVRGEWRNPRKIYSVDIGFKSVIEYAALKDIGRVYENLVFLELRRKHMNIRYIKQKQEVDFYFVSEGKGSLINVCYDLNEPSTREREIRGLLEAMESHTIKRALIITNEVEEQIEVNDRVIDIVPLWKWLLRAP